MIVKNDYSLKNINAFGVDVVAKAFVEINSPDDLSELSKLINSGEQKIYILGEGWNTLFTKDFDGVVVKINLKGIEVTKENTEDVHLSIGAGEDWIDLVSFALKNNWAGIENLNYIPGSVGAAPVQNIAAYGQNFDEVFESLEAFDIESGTVKEFSKEECRFKYRTSIFKKAEYKKCIITRVNIKLSKDPHINLDYHSRYGSIKDELATFANPPYSIHDVAKAVKSIRLRKFSDWKVERTAGSFFLNPVITKVKLAELQKIAPDVQFYPVDELTYPTPDDPAFVHADHVKVAAGWLLEELGWKGKRIGNVGTSTNQALVVINRGGATAKEILEFTQKMQEEFEKAYGISLEPEVNII